MKPNKRNFSCWPCFIHKKSKKKILSIDVTGTAASAKVELAFSDAVYTDYYNLLKIGDQWYIMNTTYHTRTL